MNTTTIKSVSQLKIGLRRAACLAAAMMCLAAAGKAQEPEVPKLPSAQIRVGEELSPGPIVGEPVDLEVTAPVQCPSQELPGGGVDDQFSTANFEPAAPSATLKARVGGPFVDFDSPVADTRFVHTYRLPPCKCLVGAKLEFRTRSLNLLSNNDSVNLGFSALQNFIQWSRHLTDLPAGPGPVYSLDLAALPIVPPGTVSLLSGMQMNRYLDLYIQDDTSIDYAKLKVTMCDCCQPQGRTEICMSKFFDKNRNGVKDANEPFLAGWTFQVADQAGGNLVISPPTTNSGKVCVGVPAPATYVVSEVPKTGWSQTTPVNPSNPVVTVTPGGPLVNLLFGNWGK